MAPVVTSDGLRDFPPDESDVPITRWAIASGSGDVIEVSYDPALDELVDGIAVAFRASAANATTTPSFSPDGLTEKTIRKASGALAASDLLTSGEYLIRYNSTLDVWMLI